MLTWIQKAFYPIKKLTPFFIHQPIRAFITAFGMPVRFSLQSGHFISSFKLKSVNQFGKPIPWYTFPCIDFLGTINFEGRRVLEFGAGQSTLWWSGRTASVTAFEGSHSWYMQLKRKVKPNVDLHLVSLDSVNACIKDINTYLEDSSTHKFDVIIIDGLYRTELIPIAQKYLAESGCIICDNAEGYSFYEGFAGKGYNRVDFYGYAPGVILKHCTSVFYKGSCFLFSNNSTIKVLH